jgi:putative ABC transporter-associated repeat protein
MPLLTREHDPATPLTNTRKTPMTNRPHLHRQRAGGIALAGLVLALLLPAVPAQAGTDDDADLDQSIESDQQIVHGEKVLTAGHVDMGPRFVDGEWRFLIHDDAAKADAAATSVWRYPDETVFHIRDEGMLPAPDDAAYAFLGAAAGDPVWVSPQTQDPEVVWLGWNTQDPDVMESIDRGVTLTLRSVDGPGQMTVFLQSGSFGEPEVLWSSAEPAEQPVWVDINTHTHANWAFTEPGVYLIELEASADLIDGSTVADDALLRVAVGSATDPLAALKSVAEPASPDPSESSAPAAADGSSPGEDAGPDVVVVALVAAIALVAAGLLVAVVVVVVRGRRAKARALAARTPEDVTSDGTDR